MRALGRLLRLSLAPSAAADVAAGTVLAAGVWPAGGAPFVLMLGSLCVYHGGMALNDWADRAEDAAGGRPRPIPQGAIRASTALALALVLLAAGPLLAYLAAPRCALVLGLVALLAALYDLAGRGPWLGPSLLGACRAGNLGAGIALGLEHALPGRAPSWPAAALYGLYVLAVSRLARLEDAPAAARAAGRPRRSLAAAAACLALLGLAGFLRLWHGPGPAPADERIGVAVGAALALAGAAGLARRCLARGPWSRAEVMSAVGTALRRLLVATASLSAQAGGIDGLVVAGLILCGYPLSFALRRAFPPT